MKIKDLADFQSELFGVLAPQLGAEIIEQLAVVFREHSRFNKALLEISEMHCNAATIAKTALDLK